MMEACVPSVTQKAQPPQALSPLIRQGAHSLGSVSRPLPQDELPTEEGFLLRQVPSWMAAQVACSRHLHKKKAGQPAQLKEGSSL